MRQIGTLPDAAAARRLADYLLTLNIESRLQQDANGWEVWVCDEDRIARAREEWKAFEANPDDARFVEAGRQAERIRQAEELAERNDRRRQVDLGERFRRGTPAARTATTFLIVVCVVVMLGTRAGSFADKYAQELFISPFEIQKEADGMYLIGSPGPEPILHGQVWRLVTPIFLHFSLWHLVGNMMWLYYLGNQIERIRGTVRFLLMVLVIAVLSNLAQYFLGAMTVSRDGFVLHLQPNFGGMSGVVFGLFGYVWMKMRFEPELGLYLSQQAFVLSLIWFLWCFTGLAGPIANASHTVGLLVGILIGAAPSLRKMLW